MRSSSTIFGVRIRFRTVDHCRPLEALVADALRPVIYLDVLLPPRSSVLSEESPPGSSGNIFVSADFYPFEVATMLYNEKR